MHRMLLEDGSLQRRIKNMQGNDLEIPTFDGFVATHVGKLEAVD